MCGIGVTSLIDVISSPAVCNDLIADSRPEPGPLTNTSTVFKPCSIAALAAVSAASPAANGVLFLEPLNPSSPALAHEITFPLSSVIVTIVLLKLE